MIQPVLAAWRFERRGRALDFGRPPVHDLREIMDAILYVDRTGVQWRLPHDFPPWETVYGYFAKWQKDGVFAQLNGLLRELVRQQEGRNATPSACVLDAQSVKTSTSVPASSQGTDAGKKIVGRKRSIVTDTIGLLLAVLVTAASVQDSVAGTQLLDQAAVGDRGGLADGGLGTGFHPCLAAVAVPGERPTDHDDQAGVGVDDDLVVGGLPVVLRPLGDGVVAGGDESSVHDEHGVLRESFAGLEDEHRPEVVDDPVGRRLWTPRTVGRAAAS
ncbi:Transposase DDE domain-containing protein [Streptomyces sp. DI166]|nr:Transposase DDE domain-containing protein [Streptomyces sp. DI166]